MCTDLLDCLGLSFTWISGPVKTLLYSIVVCFIVVMVLFIFALFMKIQLSLKTKRAILLAGVGNLSHASVILTEKLTIPIYDTLNLNNFPLFDVTIYEFARQIIESGEIKNNSLFNKKIVSFELLHNCTQGTLIPSIGINENMFPLNFDPFNPLSLVNPGKYDFYTKSQANTSHEVANLNMLHSIFPHTKEWDVCKISSFLKSERICDYPYKILKFADDTSIVVDEYNLMLYAIANNIEFRSSISSCTSFNCEIGFVELFESYKNLGSDIVSSEQANIVRSRRSSGSVSCSGFNVLGLFNIISPNCEVMLNLDTPIIRELYSNQFHLANSLNQTISNVNTMFNHLNLTKVEIIENAKHVSKLISENTLSNVQATYLINFISRLREIRLNQRTDFISSFYHSASLADDIIRNLKDLMSIHIWAKRCIVANDCHDIHSFLAKRISYWSELLQHNFNPVPKLIDINGNLIFQFYSPEKIVWMDTIIPVMPELNLAISCRSIDSFSKLCEKCYFQPKKYLTVNFNNTNDNFHKLETHKVYISKLNMSDNCILNSEMETTKLLIGGHCLTFSSDEIVETNVSYCDHAGTIEAQFIKSAYLIPNHRNVEMVYNIKLNDDFPVFHELQAMKGIDFNILNITDMIGVSATLSKDLSFPFKNVVSINSSVTFSLIGFNLILSLTIVIFLLWKSGVVCNFCALNLFKDSQVPISLKPSVTRRKSFSQSLELSSPSKASSSENPASPVFKFEVKGVKLGGTRNENHIFFSDGPPKFQRFNDKIEVYDPITNRKVVISKVSETNISKV
jgi:hypothetical protein